MVCEYWPPGNVEGQYREEVGSYVKEIVGTKGPEGGYVKYIYGKMNGGARRGVWREALVAVTGGAMALAALFQCLG